MRIGDKDMDFNTILAQIAARHNTTPEEVYRQMQISIEDAYQKRFEENGRAALIRCPTICASIPSPLLSAHFLLITSISGTSF